MEEGSETSGFEEVPQFSLAAVIERLFASLPAARREAKAYVTFYHSELCSTLLQRLLSYFCAVLKLQTLIGVQQGGFEEEMVREDVANAFKELGVTYSSMVMKYNLNAPGMFSNSREELRFYESFYRIAVAVVQAALPDPILKTTIAKFVHQVFRGKYFGLTRLWALPMETDARTQVARARSLLEDWDGPIAEPESCEDRKKGLRYYPLRKNFVDTVHDPSPFIAASFTTGSAKTRMKKEQPQRQPRPDSPACIKRPSSPSSPSAASAKSPMAHSLSRTLSMRLLAKRLAIPSSGTTVHNNSPLSSPAIICLEQPTPRFDYRSIPRGSTDILHHHMLSKDPRKVATLDMKPDEDAYEVSKTSQAPTGNDRKPGRNRQKSDHRKDDEISTEITIDHKAKSVSSSGLSIRTLLRPREKAPERRIRRVETSLQDRREFRPSYDEDALPATSWSST
eukprot:NODE_2002_length_1540_cov_32.968948_g1905_i0.p1 GENE.NODE_2002_length_1540_cov_32.968948_g1905_i0~~NODE_2002_length_1540_cov_32.968948_g1905_i0.p1  ORF type:complete len:452 (+),score=62.12 NODE_2002_length_1540_cov_32.968948_g1905_i0:118-1473(+)